MLSFYLSLLETEEQKSFVEQLYTRYEQYMYKSAFGILHNRHDAEDAVHNAFMRIVKNIDNVMHIERSKIKSFIVIIIRNCAITIYRKKKKDSLYDIDDENMPDVADTIDMEQDVLNRIEREKIRSVLNGMKEDQKHILIMRYYLDMSIENIASSLDITYDAARKRLDRAKSSLMKALSEEYRGE